MQRRYVTKPNESFTGRYTITLEGNVNGETVVKQGGPTTQVLALNLDSRQVQTFQSIRDAAGNLSIDSAVIWHRLNNPKRYDMPAKGYVFRHIGDVTPWPK